MNITSETKGKTKDGADITLSEILTVDTLVTKDETIVANAFGSDSAIPGANHTSFKDGSILADGDYILEQGDFKYILIKVDMAETVGNEANHDGATVPSIVFGINVYATQYTYETDSFDDQYDAGLENSQNGTSRTLSDGSTVFFYNEDSGYNGRVRLTDIPENVGGEYVVPAEVNDLGGALVGKTLDKLTVPAGIAYGYKSLEGANIKEVVIEDGATTVPNRLFYKTNVENIVIPDSVTTIEENAFAMATSTTLTIPASVTKIGEAAFQHMDNLTTVTIEGNVDIEGYAFRGCDVLSTVNLNGEDVNFVVSATGKNSCWFCNGESNNPGTSNITFNVKNDTVAQKLLTAMGADITTIRIFVNGTAYQW